MNNISERDILDAPNQDEITEFLNHQSLMKKQCENAEEVFRNCILEMFQYGYSPDSLVNILKNEYRNYIGTESPSYLTVNDVIHQLQTIRHEERIKHSLVLGLYQTLIEDDIINLNKSGSEIWLFTCNPSLYEKNKEFQSKSVHVYDITEINSPDIHKILLSERQNDIYVHFEITGSLPQSIMSDIDTFHAIGRQYKLVITVFTTECHYVSHELISTAYNMFFIKLSSNSVCIINKLCNVDKSKILQQKDIICITENCSFFTECS